MSAVQRADGWLRWERGDPSGSLELGRLAIEADDDPGTALDRLPEWSFVCGLAFTGQGRQALPIIERTLGTVQGDPFLHTIWLYVFTVVSCSTGIPKTASTHRSGPSA